ncbi:hypothetical protein TSACC_3256 [Terrimicrobium sacchariphilum]|uniref:Uncharacterized protein n=1 Tax=Terrimicrobium sacchariphilum TaxID=690879 RepID=A0A146GDH4_TERSA|nr:hypothetical protein TSACC_3256 [Terrimicrobium sacchariphilum]
MPTAIATETNILEIQHHLTVTSFISPGTSAGME